MQEWILFNHKPNDRVFSCDGGATGFILALYIMTLMLRVYVCYPLFERFMHDFRVWCPVLEPKNGSDGIKHNRCDWNQR